MSKKVFDGTEWKEITDVALDGLPIGFSLPFRGITPPFGWLVEDGREVSRTTYSALFKAIGTLYGEGDGETTFNLPNSIGLYTRGGIGEDIGKKVEAGLPNITGNLLARYHNVALIADDQSASGAFIKGEYNAGASNTGMLDFVANEGGFSLGFDAANANHIYGRSDTVTPPTLIALPCIKAYDSIANLVELNLAQEVEDLKKLPELTDERIVATLNGKNVYEKTFYFASSGAINAITVIADCSNLNVDKIISINGMLKEAATGNSITLDYSDNVKLVYWASNEIAIHPVAPNSADSSGFVNIRYTKTTD